MAELLRAVLDRIDGKKSVVGIILMVLFYVAKVKGWLAPDVSLCGIAGAAGVTGVGVLHKMEKTRREAEGVRHSLQDVARAWENVTTAIKAEAIPADPPELNR